MIKKYFSSSLLFPVVLFFYSCQKQPIKNISKLEGTWDFETHFDYVTIDSLNLDNPIYTDTTFHYIGKIIHLEGHIIRLIYNENDTVELMVNTLGEIHNCWWLSSACIYRGFDFPEFHGSPAGLFKDYCHLEKLRMYSIGNPDVHISINGTKISD